MSFLRQPDPQPGGWIKKSCCMKNTLTLHEISSRLVKRAPPVKAPTGRGRSRGEIPAKAGDLTCAAVLVPLVHRDQEWHLVFTHRTHMVESHKGQVSFPGGACQSGETAEQTALREAEEEIGLRPQDVRLLGRLGEMDTITAYRITPLVGSIPWPYSFRPSPTEVERVFSIPIQWLADRRNWQEKKVTSLDGTGSVAVIIYQPYEGEILWGASARITMEFLQVVGLLQ